MIDKLNHYSMTNTASVYDEEALTALELAGRTAGKVNECVENFNALETKINNELTSIPEKVANDVQKHIDDGSFDESINEYAGDLERRLDNILREGGDSTPELVDARLGANEVTYPSTGEAIRKQAIELSEGMMKENLINFDTLTGGYLQTTGDLHPSHQTGTFQRWEYTTDFIPVSNELPYIISIIHTQERMGWYAIATYDANKRFIDRGRTYEYTARRLTRKFTFPVDVAYVRISYRSYMTDTIKFEQSSYATKHVKGVDSANLMNDYPLQFDGYIVDNGSIFPQTEGEFEQYSRHIPVTVGDVFELYHRSVNDGWCAVGFYNVNGAGVKRLSYIGNGKFTFTIPENCVSIMLCARTNSLTDFALFKRTKIITPEQRSYEHCFETLTYTEPNTIEFDENVKAISHRGYALNYTENSLEAFKMAVEKGFKYVECDVRFTSDDVPVLMHDETINRTTSGTGSVSAMTYQTLVGFKLKDGQKIPTFAEFIALCKSLGVRAYVEIKDGDYDQVRQLDGIVRMYGMCDRVTYISFGADLLYYISIFNARARLGLVTETVDDETINAVETLKTSVNEVFIDAEVSIVNHEVVTLCVQNDIPLEVWTVNNETQVLYLNPYVTGVTSDYTNARQVLRKSIMQGTMTDIPDSLSTLNEMIRFTIASDIFKAPVNSTWDMFAQSTYDEIGLTIDGDNYVINEGNGCYIIDKSGQRITSDELITDGGNYLVEV